MTSNKVHPGQMLTIKNTSNPSTHKTVKSEIKYHTVKKGDCIQGISKKYHCSTKQITHWNHIGNKKLQIGQKLIVMKKEVKEESIDANSDKRITPQPIFSNNYKIEVKPTMEQTPVDSLLAYANKFLGKPYRSHVGGFIFDCSGYVAFLYSKFGKILPHSSPAQAVLGEKLEIKDLQKGDLVFFTGHNSRSKRVGHVGIVVSADGTDFTMIHSSSRGVVIEHFRGNPYFEKRYITARRIPVKG